MTQNILDPKYDIFEQIYKKHKLCEFDKFYKTVQAIYNFIYIGNYIVSKKLNFKYNEELMIIYENICKQYDKFKLKKQEFINNYIDMWNKIKDIQATKKYYVNINTILDNSHIFDVLMSCKMIVTYLGSLQNEITTCNKQNNKYST